MARKPWAYGDRTWVQLPSTRSRSGFEFRFHWDVILWEAKRLVDASDGMTLRQLYYRLVSAQLIPNVDNAYQGLSRESAKARRAGWFPSLIDQGREIARPPAWKTAAEAQDALKQQFRIDRTEGQPYNLYVAVEKNALKRLLISWFFEKGIPVVALGGYGSQTIADDLYIDAMGRHEDNGKDNILVYGHDFDGDGEDLIRDVIERSGCWHDVEQVALNIKQVLTEGPNGGPLPINPGKDTSPRSKAFNAKYRQIFERIGVESMQVELDALEPPRLRELYETAIDQYWDDDAYGAALEREATERDQIPGQDDHDEPPDEPPDDGDSEWGDWDTQ